MTVNTAPVVDSVTVSPVDTVTFDPRYILISGNTKLTVPLTNTILVSASLIPTTVTEEPETVCVITSPTFALILLSNLRL